MGFFGKKKNSSAETQKVEENVQVTIQDDLQVNLQDQNKKPEMIECFDSYGRKMLIEKQEWITKVLPEQIQRHWEEPGKLYMDILLAVKDEIPEYVIDAGIHLKEIDTIKERGYVMLSIIYLKCKQYEQAKIILNEYISLYGKTGTVLTNLAKVYFGEDKKQEGIKILWEGLQLDPNQENGLVWWLALQKEAGGLEAYEKGLQDTVAIAGSFLPQLYLARTFLEKKEIDKALNIYKTVVKEYGNRNEVLFMTSGDMGKAGLVKEMLELVGPCYKLGQQDERIGLNLLQGLLQSKRKKEGQELLAAIMKLNRPDLKDYLLKMSAEFEKLDGMPGKIALPEDAKMEICGIERPIWHYGLKDKIEMEQHVKKISLGKIGILAYTNAGGVRADKAHAERETALGRLTRSLPLFFGEMLYYKSDFEATALIPLLRGVGPVLSGKEWLDETLIQTANRSQLDWIVTGNMFMCGDDFCIASRILHVADGFTKTVVDTIPNSKMGEQLLQHVHKVIQNITQQTGESSPETCEGVQQKEYYQVPDGDVLMEYLNSLGQSLIQTLIMNKVTPLEKMYGERNIINDYLMCCLHMPTLPQVPVVMASGLLKSKMYGSEIYKEFKTQAQELMASFEKKDTLEPGIVAVVNSL